MPDFLNPEHPIGKHGSKLPHWQQAEVMQFITFRLGDAMPQSKLRTWREERETWLKHHSKPWTHKQEAEYHRHFTDKIEHWLDQGAGSCIFQDHNHRSLLEEILMRFNGQKVKHHAWVMMPNHVHLISQPIDPIANLIKAWKGTSSRVIGMGSIWQRNYRDTLIRDSEHFANAVRYIRNNPKHLNQSKYTLWQSSRALAIS